ncbi:hypothetical protein V8C86DRAFT_2593822, partial [Haematococcus lacustris]
MQAGVLHLCRWLTACVEGLPTSPYDVRESFESGRHRSGLGGRRSELVFCGCWVPHTPVTPGCVKLCHELHRNSRPRPSHICAANGGG